MINISKWQKHIAFIAILVFIFTITLVSSNLALASQKEFNDIQGHWAGETIQKMADAGIISGNPDGTFKPEGKVTRAEFATMLVKAYNSSGDGKIFSDTASHWAKDYIAIANANGIVNGYNANSFGPNDPITREQMAVMIVKAAKLEISTTTPKFTDQDKISPWANSAVATANFHKVINGMPDGSFAAQDAATRAQAAVVINASLNVKVAPPTPLPEPDYSLIDKAGTYGPASGTKTIDGNVTIKAKEVTLKNLNIKGDLIIAKEVGNGDVTLDNITVQGKTYIRGGGKNSIHINGGEFNEIIVEKTATGSVRIVAVNNQGVIVTIAENATGEEIILNGDIKSITVKADDVKITTQGQTTIGELNVASGLNDVNIDLAKDSTVKEMVLDSKVAVNGEGTIKKASGSKVKEVTFPRTPDKIVAPSTGGGGGISTKTQPVINPTSFNFNKNNVTDIPVNITWGNATKITEITGSALGGIVKIHLKEGIEYTIKDNGNGTALLTIKHELTKLLPVPITAVPDGTELILTINFDQGEKNFIIKVVSGPTVAVTGVSLNKAELTLIAGGAPEILIATVAPVNSTNKNIIWSSSNETVATVVNGLVTPKAAGTATITATSGADGTKKAGCMVTVTEATRTITFIIVDSDDHDIPISGAIISVDGQTLTTDENGKAIFTLGNGALPYEVTHANYDTASDTTEATGDATITKYLSKKAVTLSNIAVKTPPNKVEYVAGEFIDLTGLVIILTKSDSTTEEITFVSYEDFVAKGIEASEGRLSTVNNEITITHKESEKNVTQPITVKAFTVTFNSQGGSAVAAINGIGIDGIEKFPDPPNKEGFTFGGWFTDINGAGIQLAIGTKLEKNITVYAKWIETPVKITPVVNEAIAATAIDIGQTLAISLLAGTFKVSAEDATVVTGTLAWDQPNTVVNETGNFAWTFIPTDTATYNVVKGAVRVTALTPVTVSVVTTSSSESFKVNLAPAVAGLGGENFALSLNNETIQISVSGGDSEYWVAVEEPLTRKQAYSLTLTKEGYNFGEPIEVVIPGAGEVKGKVVDKDNNPLEDVNVSIFGGPILGKDTTTNVLGEYSIQNVIEGTYGTLSFTKHGYMTVILNNITVKNGESNEIEEQQLLTEFQAKVAKAKANLTLGDLTAVIADLTLPLIQDDAAITWASSNTDIITNDGKVTRPAKAAGNATVILTATITAGTENDTKDFTVIVLATETDETEQAVIAAEQAVAEFADGVYTREEYNAAIGLRNTANTKVSALENGDTKTTLEGRMTKLSEDLAKYKVLLDEYDALKENSKYDFTNPLVENLQNIVKKYDIISGRNTDVYYTWVTSNSDLAYIYEFDIPDHPTCELVIFRPENGEDNATTTLDLTMTYLGKTLKNSFIITIAEFTADEQVYINAVKEKANALILAFQTAYPENGMAEGGVLDLAIEEYDLAHSAVEDNVGLFIGNLDKIAETYHNISRIIGAMEYIIQLLEDQIPTGELYENFYLPTTEMLDWPDITVSWESSNPDGMDNVGNVTRPSLGEENAEVTLTLTLSSAIPDLILKSDFIFTVLAINPLEEMTIEGVNAVDMEGAENNGKVLVTWTPLTPEQIATTGANRYIINYMGQGDCDHAGLVFVEDVSLGQWEIPDLIEGQTYDIYVNAYNEYFNTKDGEPVTVTPIDDN